MLVATAPAEFKPKPDTKTGKMPDPPAALFYWAGTPGGDYQGAEPQMLAAPAGGVTLKDGQLNAWAASVFKVAAAPKPASKPAQPAGTDKNDIAKVKDEAKAAEADISNFGMTPGTPNFHIFHDPMAPSDVPLSFQVSLPLKIILLGMEVDTVYQARGVFVPGAHGPAFKPYYSYIGSARIPIAPGCAQKFFDDLVSKYAQADGAKQYADAWAKYTGATLQDGAIVLAVK